jgi:predicted dehydrogenase
MALKIGIVGMNGIGYSHAPHHKADELADLVAICDAVKERADKAAEQFGTKAYYDLEEMLANEELDVVDVCTGGLENGSWHYEPAMVAMEEGKNVLVEKPLSSDVEQAREMVATADAMRVYLGCNLNHFFTPPADKAKELQNEGKLGELVYCLTKMGFQGGEPESYSAPGSKKVRDFPYFHMKAFMSHPLSVMRHYMGEATHVQSFMSRPGFRKSAGDSLLSTCSIHLRYANDAVGYLLSQRGDATYGLGGWWSCEVAGTKGTFCIENCIEKVTYWQAPDGRGPGAPAIIPPGEKGAPEVFESGTRDFGLTFKNRLHAFLEDISNQVPRHELRASGRDALAVLELTYAAMDSYEEGGALVRPHPLPPLEVRPEDLLG